MERNRYQMTTAVVVGAGDVGGATAHALAASDSVARVIIVDPSAKVAAGKALDIQQAGAVAGFHTRLQGTDDLTRVIGCAVCVIADQFGDTSSQGNVESGLAMLSRLVPMLSGVPLIFAGAGHGPLIELAWRELGLPRGRLIGSAPDAFASALRAIVALEARCSPSEVSLAVLGRPPGGLVVPWSDASVGGHALEHRLEAVQITRLESGAERLWPPGPYALGLAAARASLAVVSSARRSCSALTVLDGEFGVRHVVGVVPATLSADGIAETQAPALTTRESVRLLTALGAAPAGRGIQ
jgi:malate dehydrogenase